MKYPIQIVITSNLSCIATFPDHPGIFVEGSDPSTTMDKAAQMLIKTLTNLLKCKGPVQMPSPCRLGQQLIAIPDDLAIRIQARNTIHRAMLDKYQSHNELSGQN
jgi:hypothetical protein